MKFEERKRVLESAKKKRKAPDKKEETKRDKVEADEKV